MQKFAALKQACRENVFKGIYSKTSFLVPADKRKEYALLFKKRGAGKKIRIKTK